MLSEQTFALDWTKVITHISDVSEARALPCGVVIGDTCGGRSFNDNIAAILEARSLGGWREIEQEQECWTVIVLAR